MVTKKQIIFLSFPPKTLATRLFIYFPRGSTATETAPFFSCVNNSLNVYLSNITKFKWALMP